MGERMENTSERELVAARRAKRARAVRLSPEGIAVLDDHLETRWRAEFPDERLTRPLRAELLGVSVRTADRLLSGSPVDRSSVATAFARTACELLPEYLIEQDPTAAGNSELGMDDDLDTTDEDRIYESVEVADSPVTVIATSESSKFSSTTESVRRESRSDSPPRAFYWALLLVPVISVMIIAGATTGRGNDAMANQQYRESIQILLTKGHDAYQKGEYDKSERLFYEVLEKNQVARDTTYFADAKRGLANLAIYRGDYSKALKLVDESLALHQEFDADNPYGPLNETKGDIYMKLGSIAEAEKSYRTSIIYYGRSNEPLGVAMVQGELGSIYTKTNRLAEAETELTSALKWLKFNKRPREIAAIQLLRAELRIKQNRIAEAIQIARDALAYFTKEDHKRWKAKSNLVLGRALLAAKSTSQAESCFKEAESLYREIKDREGLKSVLKAKQKQ